MRYGFHPGALMEFRHAADYYGEVSPDLETRFVNNIQASIDLAREAPFRFQLIDDGARRSLTPVFPYATIYSIEANEIYILSIMHCARKPGYWKKRL